MALGPGNGTLTTTPQLIAESGEPAILLCGAVMILMHDPDADAADQFSWPADTPYPTDGIYDIYGKVAAATATYNRAIS